MGAGLGESSVPHSRAPTGCMQWQVLSRAGATDLRQLHPPHPTPACPPTCQLLNLKGRAHREGPGCQGAWAQLLTPPPLRAAPSMGSAGAHALGQVKKER